MVDHLSPTILLGPLSRNPANLSIFAGNIRIQLDELEHIRFDETGDYVVLVQKIAPTRGSEDLFLIGGGEDVSM